MSESCSKGYREILKEVLMQTLLEVNREDIEAKDISDSTLVWGADSILDSITTVEFILNLESRLECEILDEFLGWARPKGRIELGSMNIFLQDLKGKN